MRARVRALAEARGVAFVSSQEVAGWLDDPSRTTYLLDVRTPEEVAAGAAPGFVHAPGGQLVQATDQWIGTRGARVVVVDNDEVRAAMTAQWLRQLGHEAYVLEGGIANAAPLARVQSVAAFSPPDLAQMAVTEVAERMRDKSVRLIDLRPGMSYRKEHIDGALWSIRPRIGAVAADPAQAAVMIADEPGVAALAALDLAAAGVGEIKLLAGGHAAARAAGLQMAATPNCPSDADCIDFLFFTHSRHDGDAEAARQYLAWEQALVSQLDAQERGIFRLPGRNAA
jgi:rhodanese-related sulfurtransferase